MGAVLKGPLTGEHLWKGIKFSLSRSEEQDGVYQCSFQKTSILDKNRYQAILEAELLIRTTSGLEICNKPKPLYVFGWCFKESAPDQQFLIDKARYIIDSILELEADHCL